MKPRFIRNLIIGGAVIGLLSGCVSVNAGRVSPARHPNLAAAQTFVERAIARISDAQAANEYDMNGHAAKAKALLNEAYSEIKLAALASNANR